MMEQMQKIKKSTALLLFLIGFLGYIFLGTSFSTRLSAEENIQCIWTGIEKIVAVGDIHGDYKNFVKILKNTKLVDKNLHWIGEKTHLVQTGDILDRGSRAKEALDLLMKLEKEAKKTGGKVHVLIGNHEEMNITGIAFGQSGYVLVDQFVSFIPDKYRLEKEKEFRKKEDNESKKLSTKSPSEESLKKFWEDVLRKDPKAKKEYFNGFNEKYGKWLLGKNTVIKINDIVFTHGGISEEFSTWKLKDINEQARKELKEFRNAQKENRSPQLNPKIVFQPEGPLWFRDLALNDEEDYKEDVKRILKNLGAEFMVVAHTPRLQKGKIMNRFNERVWIIDTGIADVYGGNLTALIIENGQFNPKRY